MDLNKIISIKSESPKDLDTCIVCFNIKFSNHVFNMPSLIRDYIDLDYWKEDEDAVGIWKIKKIKL